MKDAFELLRAQQEKAPEGSACWMVAEQLMDICRAEPYNAELIAQDLKNKSMSIAEAEKKIRDRADEKHRKNGGSSVCVSPKEAEEILRKFYGLPDPGAVAEAPAGVLLDFADFMR
ncbi:MAG: hypothetical protein IJ705_07580 [Oscillospiraceae bacterium]|nr:hypothetical protein [Oscillospiraceae bacterium]